MKRINHNACVSPAHPVLLLIVFVLAACDPYPGQPPDTGTDKSTPVWYEAKFFSLKPGSALSASRFRLLDKGVFEFTIAGETMLNPRGTYRMDDTRFEATADFAVHKKTTFKYRLSLTGIKVFESCAGTARLQEYTDAGKQTQEIMFLFFAENESESSAAKKNPFF